MITVASEMIKTVVDAEKACDDKLSEAERQAGEISAKATAESAGIIKDIVSQAEVTASGLLDAANEKSRAILADCRAESSDKCARLREDCARRTQTAVDAVVCCILK